MDHNKYLEMIDAIKRLDDIINSNESTELEVDLATALKHSVLYFRENLKGTENGN